MKRVTSLRDPSPLYCARGTQLLLKKFCSGGGRCQLCVPIWLARDSWSKITRAWWSIQALLCFLKELGAQPGYNCGFRPIWTSDLTLLRRTTTVFWIVKSKNWCVWYSFEGKNVAATAICWQQCILLDRREIWILTFGSLRQTRYRLTKWPISLNTKLDWPMF